MNNEIGFKPCAIVPVYNHGNTTAGVVDTLCDKGLDTILVDDGSSEDCHLLLTNIADERDFCTLITLEENQGKGGAVMRGLNEALALGYSHALQVDADAQHDLTNVSIFIEAAREQPRTLIAGFPVYDETVPTARKFGRKITDFFVCIETLSHDIVDAMCGFRLYPLEGTCNLIQKATLKKRMEFDIQILVKLHWTGMDMKFYPIRVIYPEGGISHFRMFHDNVAISKAHTLLVIGMILRFPVLLYRKSKRKASR